MKLDDSSENKIFESISVSETFRCELCKIDFQTKLELAGHKAGKHRSHRCSICNETFQKGGELGRHKIDIHGYTREKLGWRSGGWNKGMGQYEAFKAVNPHHGSPDFMRALNGDATNMEKKRLSHKLHEQAVVKKQAELRAEGYRTFVTSNWSSHQSRLPDMIAISPDGKVIAVEMESIRKWKSRIDKFREKYRKLLLQDGFFDDVVVEGFLGIDWPTHNPEE